MSVKSFVDDFDTPNNGFSGSHGLLAGNTFDDLASRGSL